MPDTIRHYETVAAWQHRVAALAFAGIGEAILVFFLAMYFASDSRPDASPVAIMLGLIVTLNIVGAGLWLRGRAFLTVNVETRRATYRGPRGDQWDGTLDDLKPITVILHTIEGRAGDLGSHDYRVVTTGARTIALKACSTHPRARQFALDVARTWQVPLALLNGQTLQPHELDAPPGG